MINIPKMKVGIVAVSRDCFPESLSVNRRKALVDAYTQKYNAEDIYECPVCIVESEIHMVQALDDLKKAGCNALCVYLGNFGPEIAETLLAKHFDGPKMFCAAAEENTGVLSSSRGDAYCGMLNASYNLKLRGVKAYIPEYPVGTAAECADMIHDFLPIARAVYGLNHLKIISFGPRPLNFLACNAPIQQLYNLGVEIEENSELDLFEAFHKHENDPRIPEVAADAVTLLDINNTVPADLYEKEIAGKFPYRLTDTFMGFHCGNTTTKKLAFCEMKYQLIMARSLPEEVTQGTLEGDILPGDVTFFRLQSTSDAKLNAYVAEGEVLPAATHSFGSIGIFAIPEMARFYRHVLVEHHFPHHGAVAFGHYGKAIYEVFKYLGVDAGEIGYNQPKGIRYPTENPFAAAAAGRR